MRKVFNLPGVWLVYQLQKIISRVDEPEGIMATISTIAPRPLLVIASGEGRAAELMHSFYSQAGEPKQFWHVPEAGHGWIAFKRPEEYQQHLCSFFQQHLLAVEIIEYT